MRAAYIREFGGPEQVRYGELPDPRPEPADVLLAVRAVAANPVDAYVRSGTYRTGAPLPLVLGRDAVGTVLEAGPDAGWSPGRLVWSTSLGHGGRQGPFADYAVAPGDRVYPLPEGIDPIDGVAVLPAGVTAYLGLFRHAGLQP